MVYRRLVPGAGPEPRIQVQVAPRSTTGSAELRQAGTRKAKKLVILRAAGAQSYGEEEGEGGGGSCLSLRFLICDGIVMSISWVVTWRERLQVENQLAHSEME